MSKFKRSEALSYYQHRYSLITDLLEGTEAMRRSGTKYLRREQKESAANFASRLQSSVLSPFYAKAVAKSVGRAFARGVSVNPPDKLQPMIDNADGNGLGFERFAKELLQSAINYGVAYAVVEMPVVPTLGAIPYLCEIKAPDVLDIQVDYENGQTILKAFRFMESSDKDKARAKEFVLENDGTVVANVYELDNKTRKEYILSSIVMEGFSRIPIIPVYGKRVAPYMGSPVLLDLAYLNIKHFIKQSDLDWNQHLSLVPMLVVKGMNRQPDADGNVQEFVLSANMTAMIPADADIKWVTADASGIAQARESIKFLESQMESFGMELVTQSAIGTESATGRLINAAESNSILKTILLDLEWSLYNIFVLAGDILGIDATGTTVTIDKTFSVSGNVAEISVLKDLFTAGILSADEVRAELKTRKILLNENILQ